jgi:hypothetical protein
MSFLMEGLDFLMIKLKLRIPYDRVENRDFLMTWLNLRFLIIKLKFLVFLDCKATLVLSNNRVELY